jgi:hypothetical protein
VLLLAIIAMVVGVWPGRAVDNGLLLEGQADVVLLGGAAGAAPERDDVGEGALDHLAQHGPREEHLEIAPGAHVDVVLVDRRLAGPRVSHLGSSRPMLKRLMQPVRTQINIYISIGSNMMRCDVAL